MSMQPLPYRPAYSPDEQLQRSRDLLASMASRRSVRDFSAELVDRAIIENCLLAAGRAPSGANQQPWHFCVVTDPEVKRQIRVAAEEEERTFYEKRATQEWLNALAPLGTDANKPFLEIAPMLVGVFVQTYGVRKDGGQAKHYYAVESVGIACGMLIMALHQCGLSTLTHTPSPMRFLNRILGRPKSERPFVLLVVGYAAEDARVPVLTKKSLAEMATFL